MTTLPLKLLRVIPVKVDIAPEVGDEERKLCMVDCEGRDVDMLIIRKSFVHTAASLVPSSAVPSGGGRVGEEEELLSSAMILIDLLKMDNPLVLLFVHTYCCWVLAKNV